MVLACQRIRLFSMHVFHVLFQGALLLLLGIWCLDKMIWKRHVGRNDLETKTIGSNHSMEMQGIVPRTSPMLSDHSTD